MKALLIVVLVSSGFCFGQENPWTPKGENPWKGYPQQETKPIETIDSSRLVEADVDSTTLPVKLKEASLSEEQVYAKAENRANEVYKSGGDFAFGFLTGVCFNLFGVVPDLIYIAPNFKSEKRAVEKVVKEVQHEDCDKEKLEKKVKNKLKTKKALSTIGGTLTGAATQIGIALVIILM
jgi:hypothetical protein